VTRPNSPRLREQISSSDRIFTLDVLRGLASFSVCWFHMTNGNPTFLPSGWVKSSGAYGGVGVQVFFVISGFVIPFALQRAGYRIGDCGWFLLKRVARLDPPYFVAIALAIVLGYVSTITPGFRGEPFHVSLPQILVHFAYLNAFFHYSWLNPVFWTLAIEFQYYFLVALIFPLLTHPHFAVRGATMFLLAALALAFPQEQFVFHWFFLFLFGIVTFHLWSGMLGKVGYFAAIGLITCGAWFAYGASTCLTGLLTALVIALVRINATGIIGFLGRISYSLYLVHVPIGGRIINFGSRFDLQYSQKLLIVAAATLSCLAAAWVLHVLVEKPAQQWSASIGYRKKQVAPTGLGPSGT
jgi:peptidoglycan/LPS O-acetylase OafA/YrhL